MARSLVTVIKIRVFTLYLPFLLKNNKRFMVKVTIKQSLLYLRRYNGITTGLKILKWHCFFGFIK